jgi:hypothetical protein
MQTVFVVGKVPDVRQTVSLATLMVRHFDMFDPKLQPAPVKTGPRRFTVPLVKVEGVKNVLRHYNLAIRDLGWWVAQDVPAEMRRMNSNVYSFFKWARDRERSLRGVRLDPDGGFLVMNDHPLLPIYLVPTKKRSWDALAHLLAELAASFLDRDWLETAMSTSPVIPDSFVKGWCVILKLDGPPKPLENGDGDEDEAMLAGDPVGTSKTTSGGG